MRVITKFPKAQEVALNPNALRTSKFSNRQGLKSSYPKAASDKLPVLSATLLSKTPNSNPPKLKKHDQKMKPGSAV